MRKTQTTRQIPKVLFDYAKAHRQWMYSQEFIEYVDLGLMLSIAYHKTRTPEPFNINDTKPLSFQNKLVFENGGTITREHIAWALVYKQLVDGSDNQDNTPHEDLKDLVPVINDALTKFHTATKTATTTRKKQTRGTQRKRTKHTTAGPRGLQTKARQQKHKAEQHQLGFTYRNQEIDSMIDKLKNTPIDARNDLFYPYADKASRLNSEELDALIAKYPTTIQPQVKIQMRNEAPTYPQKMKQAALLLMYEQTQKKD